MNDQDYDEEDITPPSDEQIQAFWAVYAQAEPQLQRLTVRERVEQANELCKEHLPALTLEMSGHDTDEQYDLIVTADGQLDWFETVTRTVALAPALKHGKVSGFRTAAQDGDFGMSMGDFDLSTKDLEVVCTNDQGQVGLQLKYLREIPMDMQDHAQHMTYLMLDHLLGEYDFAVKVGFVEFVEEFDPQATDPVLLKDLRSAFDAFWLKKLGRTGQWPDPETATWEVGKLRKQAEDDDADDEAANDPGVDEDSDDEDEHTILLTINRSVDALAMRTDLSYCLMVQGPAYNQATFEQTRNLHDLIQAALESHQHGICTYTLLDAPLRVAYFYVSDADFAAQTVERLIDQSPLAVTSENQEPEVGFDVWYEPNWRGYLRFYQQSN